MNAVMEADEGECDDPPDDTNHAFNLDAKCADVNKKLGSGGDLSLMTRTITEISSPSPASKIPPVRTSSAPT
ncbi:hypothetical protein HK097_003501 [Rhizophlyctis rosea]|uniref:Uncharacterized protein n=1 Tax=Rhizophlyctis rosea TaxID=64517 RepID=A0AAD5S424_9FUNG|nr:hypothetical protein HK097_003501 [Rhizophlyctis rosea]